MDSKEIRIFIPRDTTAVDGELELTCNIAFCADSHLRTTAFQPPMWECQGMNNIPLREYLLRAPKILRVSHRKELDFLS